MGRAGEWETDPGLPASVMKQDGGGQDGAWRRKRQGGAAAGGGDLHALARLVVDESVGEGPVVPARAASGPATSTSPLPRKCEVVYPAEAMIA